MLLIQVREWFGPGRDCPDQADETHARYNQPQGFVTRLPLGKAILELKRYSDAFNQSKPMSAVEFSITGAWEIDDLSDEEMSAGDLRLIENLIAVDE